MFLNVASRASESASPGGVFFVPAGPTRGSRSSVPGRAVPPPRDARQEVALVVVGVAAGRVWSFGSHGVRAVTAERRADDADVDVCDGLELGRRPRGAVLPGPPTSAPVRVARRTRVHEAVQQVGHGVAEMACLSAIDAELSIMKSRSILSTAFCLTCSIDASAGVRSCRSDRAVEATPAECGRP